MAEPTGAWPTPHRMAGEAYGVPLIIGADSPVVLERLRELLPPGWLSLGDPDDLAGEAEREVPDFTVISPNGLEHVLMRDGTALARSDLDIVLGVFDAQVRAYVGLHSPNRIFVHAGVVGHRGRAIVIPGPSFSGKTTLVAELVRAGAEYYSDEFAVLDDRGLVHPYPKPLSIRTDDWLASDHPAAELGGQTGEDPLRLGLIVVTQYRVGAPWEPRALSPGETVLALLSNAVPAQDPPEETMTTLGRVLDGSDVVALQGDRGEAAGTASWLLDRMPA